MGVLDQLVVVRLILTQLSEALLEVETTCLTILSFEQVVDLVELPHLLAVLVVLDQLVVVRLIPMQQSKTCLEDVRSKPIIPKVLQLAQEEIDSTSLQNWNRLEVSPPQKSYSLFFSSRK